MIQQIDEVERIKSFTETSFNNSGSLKLRSIPAEARMHELPEQFPIHISNKDGVEAFKPSYSDRENSVVAVYLHQIGKIPRLTQEEELRFFIKIDKCHKRVGEGYQELATCLPEIDLKNPPVPSVLNQKIVDESLSLSTEKYLLDLVKHLTAMQAEIQTAQNCIVGANLRLAVCIAKKYRERGLDLLDLIQEANIGLINAVDRFDWQRGVKFGAYASWWMQQAIGCGIANHGRTIRLPAYLLDGIRKLNRTRECFHQKKNDEPSREEIAEATGLTIERILQLEQLTIDTTSLEACFSQETGAKIGDFIASNPTHDPLMEITQQSLMEEVKAALDTLPPREKQIVSLRYGLEDGEEHSLQEIGTILNLSRERIRQIEMRALNRLRHPAQREKLQEFLVA